MKLEPEQQARYLLMLVGAIAKENGGTIQVKASTIANVVPGRDIVDIEQTADGLTISCAPAE